MGGIVKKETITLVNGDASFVKSRQVGKNDDDTWSVTVRPYRPPQTEDLLQDANTSSCTCLLAGNRVRMADGSLKSIELIGVGDSVLTMSGQAVVRAIETPTLGMTRKVIELRGIGDQCLLMSDEHPLWVSRSVAEGLRKEWWGTYNIGHMMYEMRNFADGSFKELPVILNIDLPEQVAHETGWLHVRPTYHHMDPATPLYHLILENGFSYLAEGFAVFSNLSGEQGPDLPWRGLDGGASTREVIADLIGQTV